MKYHYRDRLKDRILLYTAVLTSLVNYCKFRSNHLKLGDNERRNIRDLEKNGVLKRNNGALVKYRKSGLMYHPRRVSVPF